MNKADLVNAIAEKTGETKVKAGEFVEVFMATVTEALKSGNDLTLVGFGSFNTVARKERKGRNPKTGADLQIPAHTVVKFSAGKDLREAVVNTKTPKKAVAKKVVAKTVKAKKK
jgi:DNA-binding protein HU-beta